MGQIACSFYWEYETALVDGTNKELCALYPIVIRILVMCVEVDLKKKSIASQVREGGEGVSPMAGKVEGD